MSGTPSRAELLPRLQEMRARIRAGRRDIMQADPAGPIEVLRRQNLALLEAGLMTAEQLAVEQLALEGLAEMDVVERVNETVRRLDQDEARLTELIDVLLDQMGESKQDQ